MPDSRVCAQRLLDLTRFDANAAHLDLVVSAAHVLDPVSDDPDEVAGRVPPRSEALDESLCRALGSIGVLERDLGTADQEFTRLPRGTGRPSAPTTSRTVLSTGSPMKTVSDGRTTGAPPSA